MYVPTCICICRYSNSRHVKSQGANNEFLDTCSSPHHKSNPNLYQNKLCRDSVSEKPHCRSRLSPLTKTKTNHQSINSSVTDATDDDFRTTVFG